MRECGMLTVNITIPVLNEELQLSATIIRMDAFLRTKCQFSYEIVIADNGSTDQTRQVAINLCRQYSTVQTVCLAEKGRGRALKQVWKTSNADILSYMDVDLSSDLEAFPFMIEALVTGGFDLGTGSRLLKPSMTTRGFKRELLSRCYNLLVKALLNTRFSDAQCGFKAITRKAANKLLPLVEDNHWFMDTELLVLAEKLGYRVFDLPVRWVDDADSRVEICRAAAQGLAGLLRMRKKLAGGK
jgi:glycosyltransferase involved in cell wall biosynthesis